MLRPQRILIFGVLILTVAPSWAAKRMTVEQLEQALASDLTAQKQDAEIARRLAGATLTERVPQAIRARLLADLHSRPQAYRAVTVLANQSEFLDPPPGEVVTNATPDNTTQARMLESTRHYVAETLRGLPNFLATRTIELYDDRPQAARPGEWPTRSGLHLVGTSRAEISANRERDDQPATQSSAVWESKFGLVSGGEFGSTLGMILAETAAGDVSWSHWERSSTGTLAVLRYSVPASASHFEVISSFQREANVQGARSAPDGRGVAGIELRPNASSYNVEVVRSRPAYHGSIWLDPENGAVYRITMEADMNKGLPFRRAALLVEYGPVEISGARFICPVRSLAISETQANAEMMAGTAATIWLNETLFSNYHRFGSSSRMLNENANAKEPSSTTSSEGPEHSSSLGGVATSDKVPTPANTDTPHAETGSAEKPMDPSPSIASTGPATAAEVAPTASPSAKDADSFALRIEVNSLLIPAVVRDKNGKTVGGLSKDDFVVLDDGKARPITGATLVRRTAEGETRTRQTEAATAAGATTEESQAPAKRRFIVFLFDDRHMTTDDLSFVQKAADHLLEKPLAENNYAAVVSLMGANSGITRDPAALRAAVAKLSARHALQHDREDCPDVDYFAADQILNQHNAVLFQIAVEKARQCSGIQVQLSPEDPYTGMNNPNDPFQRAAMGAATRALAMGEEDARESLASIRAVLQAMTKLQGERVLILVSSGFLTLAPETMKLKSEIMDVAAASDVVVNAMDARGLYAGNLDASHGGATSTIAMVTAQEGQNHLASMQAAENAMSELALGTGGRFFHNSNDLAGGLETLAGVPETSYLLEVSLKDVKPNGALHHLQVKLNKPGLEVLARKGYVAPKTAGGKKGNSLQNDSVAK